MLYCSLEGKLKLTLWSIIMSCIQEIKFTNEDFELAFSMSKSKQRIFIDAVLKYSVLTLTDLSIVLNVPLDVIKAVRLGQQFFEGKHANHLMIVFLIFFGGDSSKLTHD